MDTIKYIVSLLLLISVSVISGCNPDDPDVYLPEAPENVQLSQTHFYQVDLNNRSGDTFKVKIFVELSSSDNLFVFPATVPGTYSILNFGDYVQNFAVYDEDHQLIDSEQTGTNEWTISNPEDAYLIEYEMAETWDDPQPENYIFKMAGTSLEDDHALLNTFAVFGFPEKLQEKDILLEVKYPDSWSIGTSLPLNSDNYYFAEDYDFLADNPILLGSLSNAEIVINDTEVDIWTYAQTDMVHSTQILDDVDQVLLDAQAFLKELPVDRYNFLFHFGSYNSGALEHSYSSVYVLQEAPINDAYAQGIKNISAHEFFHIVTPLNLHSEIIENFNFIEPTPSAHLWLYEGVTEWASHIMQYRNNSIALQDLLDEYQYKLNVNDIYDGSYSLTDISMYSYTPEGGDQFGNIYNRGAMVAALLDIRLLKLSGGEIGLRELILDLINTYGSENAFEEDGLFEVITNKTFMEISDFTDNYIKGTEPLPVAEYFSWVGVSYDPESHHFTKMEDLSVEQEYLFNRWSMNF